MESIDKEKIRENVKTLLNIQDTIQDGVLDILINHVESHLRILLMDRDPLLTDIPKELAYVVEEVTIRRFNRLGSEGMKSESVEGHSITFSDWREDFVAYEALLDRYRIEDDGESGEVIFI